MSSNQSLEYTPQPGSAGQVLDRVPAPTQADPNAFRVEASSGIVTRVAAPGVVDVLRVRRPAQNASPSDPAIVELLSGMPLLKVDENNPSPCFAPS